MSHASRRLWSRLIFDVGQNMKKPAKNLSLGIAFDLPGEPELSDALTRVFTNVSRVSSLLTMYDAFRNHGGEKRGRSNIHTTDLLRASVVLMHATLEDGLRSLLRFRLPRTKEVFDTVALSGINDHGRAEKFFLGELHRFRGKTVDEIWDTSLDSHLMRQTFNDASDLIRAVKHIGGDVVLVKPLLGRLSALIARRHHIVHNADINEKRGKAGQQFVRSLGRAEVSEWHNTIIAFFSAITFQLRKNASAPNKAPEPTARPVTIPAEPGIAPGRAVAHL